MTPAAADRSARLRRPLPSPSPSRSPSRSRADKDAPARGRFVAREDRAIPARFSRAGSQTRPTPTRSENDGPAALGWLLAGRARRAGCRLHAHVAPLRLGLVGLELLPKGNERSTGTHVGCPRPWVKRNVMHDHCSLPGTASMSVGCGNRTHGRLGSVRRC